MPRMRKYGESKMTQIMMATVPHVTSGSGLRKFQADGFLLDRVYILAVGPIQPPTLCVPQAIRPTIKQLQSDNDQSAGPPKCKKLTQCLHTKVHKQAQG